MRIAGIGFRGAASAAALAEALDRASQGASVDGLATLADKATAPAFVALAAARGLAIHPIAPAAIAGIITPTPSQRIFAQYGTGSIAEAVALVAAGPGAQIIAPRQTTACRQATAAIAQSPHRLTPETQP